VNLWPLITPDVINFTQMVNQHCWQKNLKYGGEYISAFDLATRRHFDMEEEILFPPCFPEWQQA